MPTYNFDIETWNNITNSEFLRDANMKGGWEVDFTEAIKKIKEQENYNKVWELIKKKNNW